MKFSFRIPMTQRPKCRAIVDVTRKLLPTAPSATCNSPTAPMPAAMKRTFTSWNRRRLVRQCIRSHCHKFKAFRRSRNQRLRSTLTTRNRNCIEICWRRRSFHSSWVIWSSWNRRKTWSAIAAVNSSPATSFSWGTCGKSITDFRATSVSSAWSNSTAKVNSSDIWSDRVEVARICIDWWWPMTKFPRTSCRVTQIYERRRKMFWRIAFMLAPSAMTHSGWSQTSASTFIERI